MEKQNGREKKKIIDEPVKNKSNTRAKKKEKPVDLGKDIDDSKVIDKSDLEEPDKKRRLKGPLRRSSLQQRKKRLIRIP